MVTHLEDVDRADVSRIHRSLDDLLLGVPREQHALVALLGDDHDARLVGAGILDRFARRDHA